MGLGYSTKLSTSVGTPSYKAFSARLPLIFIELRPNGFSVDWAVYRCNGFFSERLARGYHHDRAEAARLANEAAARNREA